MTVHMHWEWSQDLTGKKKAEEQQKWTEMGLLLQYMTFMLISTEDPHFEIPAFIKPFKFRPPSLISVAVSISHLAGIQFVVWWIHETIWVLFFMRHNGHNILQWHGNVFVGGPPKIHSSIWVPVFDDWVAFGEDWVQLWRQVSGCPLALFRTAGESQIHCTHLRKGHREKWWTVANGLSIPLPVSVTAICYPACHTGGPM